MANQTVAEVSTNGHKRTKKDELKASEKIIKPAKQKIEVYDVPKPETITIPITGTSSFLSHRKDEKAGQKWEQKMMGKGNKREVTNPEEEWEASTYFHPKTRVPCILGRAVKSAIVSAAKGYWEKGAWRGVRGTVKIPEEFIPIKYGEMNKRRDFLPLMGGRGHHNSYRVEFIDWSATIKIRYDANFINPEKIVNLLNRAGFSIGIGDDRPEKGGEHGTFVVAQ